MSTKQNEQLQGSALFVRGKDGEFFELDSTIFFAAGASPDEAGGRKYTSLVGYKGGIEDEDAATRLYYFTLRHTIDVIMQRLTDLDGAPMILSAMLEAALQEYDSLIEELPAGLDDPDAVKAWLMNRLHAESGQMPPASS